MFREQIHGVVVSIDYADYLDISLTHNRSLFDHCVVATTPADKDSQKIALKHDCTVVLSDSRAIGVFNKGAMIERALLQLPHTGWRCHFDGDILFPGNAHKRLATALIDHDCIYGVDRMNIVEPEGYQRLLASGWATRGFEHQHYLNYAINRAEIGSRLIYGDHGWVPVGYVQIWHADAEFLGSSRIRPYAVGSSSAAHDDVQFSLRWDRSKRVLIPELLVAHLVTNDMSYGCNWQGRKSKKFVPLDGPGQSPPKPDVAKASPQS